MSKNHRGKGIIELYKRGRGTCPICHRTGVKIIHERENDKQKIFVCKICNVVMSRKETRLKKQMESPAATETTKAAVETAETTVAEKTETETAGTTESAAPETGEKKDDGQD
jgi:hypothetical protein